MADTLSGKQVLLVVSGGIAAYKTLELIRRVRERGGAVRCIMTKAAEQFVTPLSLAALSEQKVHTELFSLTDEAEMGHIQLSRDPDIVVVAPASADLIARMAAGMANDLATTVLLATDKPILLAPAMNVRMWNAAATRGNLSTLRARGALTVGPNEGDMACGEYGPGRMAEPLEILGAIEDTLRGDGPLRGRRALVTSGPTLEPIDPVRYLANRSSGRQGHAIAAALSRLGAETVLVSGPTNQPDPIGVRVVGVETARDMLAACEAALPADIAVCAAAVADWRPATTSDEKIKKNGAEPAISLTENPDILHAISHAGNRRPTLVVGFAAETEKVEAHAKAKLARKGCDWLLANDVSAGTGTMGGANNTVTLITEAGLEAWPTMSKEAVAAQIADRIATHIGTAK